MRNLYLIPVISCVLLMACSQLEHRSDLPEKKELPALESNVQVNEKWSSSVGKGADDKDIRLSLALFDNSLLSVDNTGTLFANDLKTGKLLWNLALSAPVSAGPVVLGDKLIVGTNNAMVIAVDLREHKVIWNTIATSEVLARPTISDNLVFVHTLDGSLSALTLLDGRQLWRFTHNLPSLVLRAGSSPAVTKTQVITGFSTGNILALNKQDGAVEWSQNIAQPKGKTELQRMTDISADPVIKDGVVYAASYQGSLVALNVNNGHLLWHRDIASFAGFALDEKLIYVAATNGDVIAVDQKTSATFWVQSSLQGRRLSKPVLSAKYIILGDEDGFVHYLDKGTGKLVTRYNLGKSGIDATPIIHDNIVYILGRNGKLVALEVN